jgi:hypothetical protein
MDDPETSPAPRTGPALSVIEGEGKSAEPVAEQAASRPAHLVKQTITIPPWLSRVAKFALGGRGPWTLDLISPPPLTNSAPSPMTLLRRGMLLGAGAALFVLLGVLIAHFARGDRAFNGGTKPQQEEGAIRAGKPLSTARAPALAPIEARHDPKTVPPSESTPSETDTTPPGNAPRAPHRATPPAHVARPPDARPSQALHTSASAKAVHEKPPPRLPKGPASASPLLQSPDNYPLSLP